MESLRIEIVNPKAKRLIKSLADMNSKKIILDTNLDLDLRPSTFQPSNLRLFDCSTKS